MASFRGLALVLTLWLCTTCLPAGAEAQGFRGMLSYTGKLGPVSSRRPLCVCVYRDAALEARIGCLISDRNNQQYTVDLGRSDYHLIGFLDIHINERVDPDEPYEIYSDRAAPPSDPVVGDSGRTDIDLIFGDENVGSFPTATPTPTRTPSPSVTSSPSSTPSTTPTPSPSSSPTPSPTACAPGEVPVCGDECVGDCNGNGEVELTELILVIGDALGGGSSSCAAGDADGDGAIQVVELVEAVRLNLAACRP